jgi:thioredoxin-like negative regulator of GroEL
LDKVKEKFPQITFDKCNVEEYPQVASLYKIRGVPALVLKAHGDIKDTIFGTLTENQLESLINNLTDR